MRFTWSKTIFPDVHEMKSFEFEDNVGESMSQSKHKYEKKKSSDKRRSKSIVHTPHHQRQHKNEFVLIL